MVNIYAGCDRIWTMSDVVEIKSATIRKTFFENSFGCIKLDRIEIYEQQIELKAQDIEEIRLVEKKNRVGIPALCLLAVFSIITLLRFHEFGSTVLLLIGIIFLITFKWKTYFIEVQQKSARRKFKVGYVEIEDAEEFVKHFKKLRLSKPSQLL